MKKQICFAIIGAIGIVAPNTSRAFEVDSQYNIFPRKMVVEEWTGTWCGMCVRGIVGMEYMNEHYGDENFIGLAVHCDDRMEASSYADFIDRFTAYSSFPGSTVNRKYIVDPDKRYLEKYYGTVTEGGSFASVKVEAVMPDEDATEIEIMATARFAVSIDNADMRIAFVLAENEVGPYTQMNTYSSGLLGELDGWEKKPNMVFIRFDDVVRESTPPLGVVESLPASIVEFEDYHYTDRLPLANVTDIDKTSLVALLIDGDTGEIVNADKLKLTSASLDFTEKESKQVLITPVEGAIRIKGDIKEGRIYTPDGRCEVIFDYQRELPLPAGLHIISLTLPDGSTQTEKHIIR